MCALLYTIVQNPSVGTQKEFYNLHENITFGLTHMLKKEKH